MAKYDLTGSLERDFTFNVAGEEFSMRKPTVREMRELVKKFQAIEKEEDQEKQTERSDEAMQAVFAYVTPIGDARAIDVVMDEQPVSVQLAFNEMIAEELGAKK